MALASKLSSEWRTQPTKPAPQPVVQQQPQANTTAPRAIGGGLSALTSRNPVAGRSDGLPVRPAGTTGGGSTLELPAMPGLSMGGGGGGAQVPATSPLSLTAQPSPDMKAALDEWKKRMASLQSQASTTDPNLQFQIEQYKGRLGQDQTQHATDRAASAIRDQMAGMQQQANESGAASGRGQGFGATGIAEAGQRALAGQASDIQLAQQNRLDALTMGGQGIMSAPAQQQLAYQGLLNPGYAQNPYSATAQLGLDQQKLGLQAYLGQLQAQNEAARTQAQIYGSPWQMFQTLYGGAF
jgi:hypothetical protein